MVTSPEEFGRDLGLVCGSSWESEVSKGTRSAPPARNDVLVDLDGNAPAGLDDEARRVWLALSTRSLGIDDVASGADLQSAPVLAVLTILQVAGLVVQESGMRFRRAS